MKDVNRWNDGYRSAGDVNAGRSMAVYLESYISGNEKNSNGARRNPEPERPFGLMHISALLHRSGTLRLRFPTKITVWLVERLTLYAMIIGRGSMRRRSAMLCT